MFETGLMKGLLIDYLIATTSQTVSNSIAYPLSRCTELPSNYYVMPEQQ